MKSAKFIACCFVEVPVNDVFYDYEFRDSSGWPHAIVGKRGDWLYITDDDMIFTKSQLLAISSVAGNMPTKAMYEMNAHAVSSVEQACINDARHLPGAEF